MEAVEADLKFLARCSEAFAAYKANSMTDWIDYIVQHPKKFKRDLKIATFEKTLMIFRFGRTLKRCQRLTCHSSAMDAGAHVAPDNNWRCTRSKSTRRADGCALILIPLIALCVYSTLANALKLLISLRRNLSDVVLSS